MLHRHLPGLLILTALVFFSCAGSAERSSPPEDPAAGSQGAAAQKDSGASYEQIESPDGLLQGELAPADLVFLPAEFPSLAMEPGVGLITQERRDLAASLNVGEKGALSGSYRAAYIDSQLRDLPLKGVLGGDMVHGWPENDPRGWAQNWRSPVEEANSWKLPALVLAVRTVMNSETGHDRVFVIQGKILDHYGKSAGINGANGSAGYGSPRGYEFLYEGKLAQRFDLGLITVDQQGKGAFIQEEPPSLMIVPPPDVGVFRNIADGSANSVSSNSLVQSSNGWNIRAAFTGAWMMAMDQGLKTMTPDGPGQYLSFPEDSGNSSWDLDGVEALRGLYIQSFNQRSILLVLPDLLLNPDVSQPSSASWPMYPRFIAAPFLNVLLAPSKYSPAGGENLKPLDIKFSGADDFSRSLMRGLSLYGIPLTDPMPVKGGEGTEEAWQLSQRFSRGWLIGRVARP